LLLWDVFILKKYGKYMPLYESTFILRQDLSAHDVNKLATQFITVLTDLGGNVVKKEFWGLRNLAYPIRKNKKGHYIFLGIDAPFEAIKEVERLMRLNENVIRLLNIRVDAINSGPTPMLKLSQNNDDAKVASAS
jgi:small subunit ribosomal protein S6